MATAGRARPRPRFHGPAIALVAALLVGGCGAPAAAATATPGAAGSADPSASHGGAPAASPTPAPIDMSGIRDLALHGPASGVWLGLNLDWAHDSVADAAARLGRPPAVAVVFAAVPLDAAGGANLDAAAAQVAAARGVLLVTLEPQSGLAAVDDAVASSLASRFAGYGRLGVPVIVRFAHEMNGSWYPWSQDPTGYVAAFRRVAAAVHAGAPNAAMLWAPNYGGGYPFTGGRYEAPPGSAARALLDTNHDGRLDGRDDPYAPYWPGDDAVDWVGMSLYHWGSHYPWGANVLPEAGKFAAQLTGTYDGAGGDDRAVPDFYAAYAEGHAKPLAIVETAGLWRPSGGGAGELAIESAWWRQVLSADTVRRFPRLRLVNWFEWRKYETEVSDTVDWRVTADPAIRRAFLADLPAAFRLGPVVPTP